MANCASYVDWRRTRVRLGVASGVVAGQPNLKSSVDEMVNLTSTPFARTIKTIKKNATNPCCFISVGREVLLCSDDVLRDMYIYCLYIYTFIYLYLFGVRIAL